MERWLGCVHESVAPMLLLLTIGFLVQARQYVITDDADYMHGIINSLIGKDMLNESCNALNQLK